MKKKLWQYFLATRPIEATLMIGFPLIGMLIALDDWTRVGALILKFTVATYGLVMYVYCLNSWGGREHDLANQRLNTNPAVTGEVTPNELLGLTIGGAIVSGLLYQLWFPHCRWFWLLIIVNWTFYSHPRLYYKSQPVRGTIIHFIGGVLQFLLGYAAVRPTGGTAWAVAVYFSLAFAGGHLNHEVMDYDADKEAGLKTSAVVFGPQRMFRIAFRVFTVAFYYLILLVVIGAIELKFVWPYLTTYLPHWWLYRRVNTGEWRGYDRKYQHIYRTLFVLAGLLLALIKWRALT